MKYTDVKVGDYATTKYAVTVPVLRSGQSDVSMFTHPSHWGVIDNDTQMQSHLWSSGYLGKDIIVQCIAKLGIERITLWRVQSSDSDISGEVFIVNNQFRDFKRTDQSDENYPARRKCVMTNHSPYVDHSPLVKQRMTDDFMRRLYS